MKNGSVCIVVLSFLMLPAFAQNKIPNIIFILCDDLAEQAIGSYGHGLNHTPSIDRIAQEGIRFTNSFVSNSICGPSRAVILTGKLSHLNGFRCNEDVFDGSQQTFPKLLQQAGYQTAIIGKWHLKSEPTGFDYWNILPGQGDYYNPDFIENGIQQTNEGYVTDLITSFSIEWLSSKRDPDRPFCLMIHHKAPHRNWMPAIRNLTLFDTADFPVPATFFDTYDTRGRAAHEQEMEVARDLIPNYDLKLFDTTENGFPRKGQGAWLNRLTGAELSHWIEAYYPKNNAFRNQQPDGKELAEWKLRRFLQDYLATVASVDEGVGQLMEYLDSAGLAANTLVIFTSDQGFYLGEHGWFDKRFMYEQSMKTPLLMKYPGTIRPGTISGAMVQNLDLAETILDFAGITIPEEMQGLSMKPLLQGDVSSIREDVYYHYYEFPGVHAVKRHYGIRNQRFKLIRFYNDCQEWEFYDLETDPDETENRYGDPAYQGELARLKKRLAQLQEEYRVPAADTMPPSHFDPSWSSLDARPVPSWFTEARFGIFIHWGVYSVPAWRPLSSKKYASYAEWYYARVIGDTLYGGDLFHRRNYGDTFEYRDFGPQFKAELFDPDAWADLFARSGANYVVLTSKHHDGYCLWPTKSPFKQDWNSMQVGPHRDLVGELTQAVRKKGLKMGLYYSLPEWESTPTGRRPSGWWLDREIIEAYGIPQDLYVPDHVLLQLRELVLTYRPSLIFADGGEWDFGEDYWQTKEFLAWLYNTAPNKEEVVVNDRWAKGMPGHHGDYYSSEYKDTEAIGAHHPWEESRGIGGSYGFNRAENLEDYSTSSELIHELIDIASRGGNLLLNVGPTADGRIPVIMQERLVDIGNWLRINGEGIFGTRPWSIPGSNRTDEGFSLWFTVKGKNLYVFCSSWPSAEFSIPSGERPDGLHVTVPGLAYPVPWNYTKGAIRIQPPLCPPGNQPGSQPYLFILHDFFN